MKKIETKDAQGNINGFLLPVWNSTDGPKIDQVYLTTILPGMMKGPHLHKLRQGLFKVLRGSVTLITRVSLAHGYQYKRQTMGVVTDPVLVLPGVPAALYNTGVGEAYVLNMPSPAWRADDQDEHTVEDWAPRLPE